MGTRCQPIGIGDVLDYLVGALDHPDVVGIVEIGAADVLSYGDMMRTYARLSDLRRLMIPVPVLTPRLSSHWVNLVSPVPAGIARPLIEGLRNEVVVNEPGPAAAFDLALLPFAESLQRAIDQTDRHAVASTWFDALAAPDRASLSSLTTLEGMIIDRRSHRVAASSERAFAEIERLGAMLAGRTRTSSGASAASRTASWGAWGCGWAAVTPRMFAWATRWTSGAWRSCGDRRSSGCARR